MSLLAMAFKGPMPRTQDGKIPDHVKCAECNGLLNDACLITNCGCRICERHLTDEFFIQEDRRLCPGGTEDCDVIEKTGSWIPDKATRRTVLGLTIICPNGDKDGTKCNHVCRFRDLQAHLTKCDFALEPCEFCGEEIVRVRLSQHREECPKREIFCEFCAQKMFLSDSKLHLDWESNNPCEQKRWNCPYCPRRGFLAHELRQHQSECDKWPQMCEFHALGCPYTGDDMEAHNAASINEHQRLLLQAVMSEKDVLLRENRELKQKNAELNVKCQEMHQRTEKLRKDFDARFKKMRTVQKVLATCREKQLNMDKLFEKHGSMDSIVQRLDSNQTPGNAPTQPVAISQNGTFLWRIDNFRNCKAAAESGVTLSVLSPPFFTDPYGYKMCCRLYPNGDGSGKGTHLSLFIVIMKNEFDSILRWPFSHRVTFRLKNQAESGSDLCETFSPDQRSNSFKRPVDDMNVASGCPRFISLAQLEGSSANPSAKYLWEDTIFIQVTVDKSR